MAVHWLIYMSRPEAAPWPATILDIARPSERRNARAGVSGMLMFSDNFYLQYLEGRQKSVTGVWRRVSGDPRHRIDWVLRGEAETPRMGALPLGFFDADREHSSAQGTPLWRARHAWPKECAEALIEMLALIAREKYPTAMGG